MAKKIFIGFVALVLVAFVLLFQFGGRAAEELTKKLLAEQTALFFCLNNSRYTIFPIPLFVAIAPLFLPYILRYKTQGRSAQCILIPKLKHHFQSSPPVFPLGNIGGVSAGRGG